MTIKVIGTGSSGNCYIITFDNGEKLILDAGVKVSEIIKGIDYDLNKVLGVLITHSHKDHSLGAEKLKNKGFKVFYPATQTNAIAITEKLGNAEIDAFKLPHNGTDNYGFLIKHENRKILYMTDFEYCPYKFDRIPITDVLIECNYSDSLVNRDLPNFQHKVLGHCSLKTCMKFLQKSMTESLQTLIFVHLGKETVSSREILAEAKKLSYSGNLVACARNGEVFEI